MMRTTALRRKAECVTKETATRASLRARSLRSDFRRWEDYKDLKRRRGKNLLQQQEYQIIDQTNLMTRNLSVTEALDVKYNHENLGHSAN